MKKIKSIEEIINDYDNFIIDQWGVMHDGTFGYEHAINSINILNSNNKNLFIISNSSKRSKSSIDRLPKLGFKKNSFLSNCQIISPLVTVFKKEFFLKPSFGNLSMDDFDLFEEFEIINKFLLLLFSILMELIACSYPNVPSCITPH